MRIKLAVLLLLISTVAFLATAHGSFAQEQIKQGPMHVTDSFKNVKRYLLLDLSDAYEYETEHYIYLNNNRNKHCLVIVKDTNVLFVGVNIYMAYLVCVEISPETGIETWSIFEIHHRDKRNTLTKMFFRMKKEFIESIIQGCPGEEQADL